MARKFSDLGTRAQAVILAAVAALIAGFAFWYLVWPLSGKRDALAKQVSDLHAQNVRDRSFEQQHAEYLQRIAEADKQLQVLRTIVPDEPHIDEFVQKVHHAEDGSFVHVRSFAAEPLNPRDLYTEMPFKVRVDGTYYSLVDFFTRLAGGERIVNVTDLVLGPAEGGAAGGTYKVQPGETVGANCVLITYFNRPVGSAPPAAAKK
jgi:type IV pilus assembly protein PilO